MGYGALSQAGYFDDISSGVSKPKVYSFKWGRNGWGNVTMTYSNVKTIGSSTVSPGAYAPDKNSFLGSSSPTCTGLTGSALVQCVGWSAIQGASAGIAAWASTSDASYRPVDIRESGELGSDIVYDNSGNAYSLNIPYQDMFDAAGSYANMQKLDESFSGTSKYVFYNKTQHTAIAAAMGARMLGYDTIGLSNGLAGWNNTVGQQWTGDPDKVSVGVMTSQSVNAIYAGTIAAAYPLNSGLNLAPTISGLSVVGNPIDTTSAIIKWNTDYPATTQINDKATYNDTVLNTSHSATLSGLSLGTYNYTAISYDCVANKAQSAATFILAAVNVTPQILQTKSKGDYVTAHLTLLDVDVSTVKLNGTLSVVQSSPTVDGVTLKFSRAAVGGIVSLGSNIMVVTGSTFGGTPFVAYDTMDVQ